MNNCAATGERMKPTARLVAMASGRLMVSDKVVLNMISENNGANAQPKNAILIWVENGSRLKRA